MTPSVSFVAVILAAGQGTRMRSARPKVLHPLAGRPLILHLLETVRALKPERAFVVIAPGMTEVASAVAPVPTVIQERPLGSADALRAATAAFADWRGTVLVLNGDVPLLSAETIRRLLDARRKAPAPGIVVLGFRPEVPGAYGRLVLGRDGGLERIVEARDASSDELAIGLCNAGIMALDGEALARWLALVGRDNAQGEYYLPDLVAIARADGARVAIVEGPAGELLGINTRAELAVAEAALQQRLRARAMDGGVTLIDPNTVWLAHDTDLAADVTVHPNVVFGPGVRVASGVVIHAFSHLEGAEIGTGAIVGPFARLRPGAVVGKSAHVGNFVEMKKARLGEGAKANHLTYLGDADIGAGANIGAGTVTCNYDGFAKHRTEIGARAFIGSNSALVAPVVIGEGAIVGAGSTITKDVPADALAVNRPPLELRAGWAIGYRKRKAKPPADKI